ncbi:hypothetical protein ACFQFQ_17595 [Sulfitobacter porphyrae]|uniref:Uncharacterized protein n=1 Tax=Sulfitobacter porphyrae TaxID=1246864 RepID=A0ABW2B6T3_9RHOB
MGKFTKFLTGTALVLSMATTAQAAETITISSWLPPSHPINTGMLQGLIDMMESATGVKSPARSRWALPRHRPRWTW